MNKGEYDHILIREATILVRVPEGTRELLEDRAAEFFDVRTGVQIPRIYPDLQAVELHRGYLLPKNHAAALIRSGAALDGNPSMDAAKVITILEVQQRKLDSVVADSILDQLRITVNLLQEFLSLADTAQKEERFWLSQQILGLIRKFTGRELSEIEEIVAWFRSTRKK
ncbi:MAG TPA: hypothetical protein VK463_16470 [Desulfomonilaceae bacterium]|nr:hypothetical protein [Desulfomonilaceae bacterium]